MHTTLRSRLVFVALLIFIFPASCLPADPPSAPTTRSPPAAVPHATAERPAQKKAVGWGGDPHVVSSPLIGGFDSSHSSSSPRQQPLVPPPRVVHQDPPAPAPVSSAPYSPPLGSASPPPPPVVVSAHAERTSSSSATATSSSATTASATAATTRSAAAVPAQPATQWITANGAGDLIGEGNIVCSGSDVPRTNQGSQFKSGDLSICFWMFLNADPVAGSTQPRVAIHKGNSFNEWAPSIWLPPTNNLIHLQLTTAPSGLLAMDSATQAPVGVPVHVCAVVDRLSAHLYVMGKLDSEQTLAGSQTPQVNSGPWYLGGSPWTKGISGWLRDVRFFDRAVSAAEVKDMASIPPYDFPPGINTPVVDVPKLRTELQNLDSKIDSRVRQFKKVEEMIRRINDLKQRVAQYKDAQNPLLAPYYGSRVRGVRVRNYPELEAARRRDEVIRDQINAVAQQLENERRLVVAQKFRQQLDAKELYQRQIELERDEREIDARERQMGVEEAYGPWSRVLDSQGLGADAFEKWGMDDSPDSALDQLLKSAAADAASSAPGKPAGTNATAAAPKSDVSLSTLTKQITTSLPLDSLNDPKEETPTTTTDDLIDGQKILLGTFNSEE